MTTQDDQLKLDAIRQKAKAVNRMPAPRTPAKRKPRGTTIVETYLNMLAAASIGVAIYIFWFSMSSSSASSDQLTSNLYKFLAIIGLIFNLGLSGILKGLSELIRTNRENAG